MSNECSTYGIWSDHTGVILAQCDQCKERHYFRSEYFAKQWANRHGHMFARTFCTCH